MFEQNERNERMIPLIDYTEEIGPIPELGDRP